MKSYKKLRLLLLGIILLLGLSCAEAMSASMAKLGRQIEVIEIGKIEMKGFTGLQIVVEVKNNSPYDITLSGAKGTLRIGDQRIGDLEQVEVVTTHSAKQESIPTVWRFANVDPMSLLMLGSKVAMSDFSGIVVDYTATLSNGKSSREVSDKDVDISKFIGKVVTK